MSLAQWYSALVGAVLLLAGIIGFFYEAEFSSDPSVRDSIIGAFEVNGWHNVIHLVVGACGLIGAYLGGTYARLYALVFGLVLVAIAILGVGFVFGEDNSIFSIVPVNTEDNIFHFVLGFLGLLAAAATPPPEEIGPDRPRPA